jgi:hypothetical protein
MKKSHLQGIVSDVSQVFGFSENKNKKISSDTVKKNEDKKIKNESQNF